jgi:hypothetical protein
MSNVPDACDRDSISRSDQLPDRDAVEGKSLELVGYKRPPKNGQFKKGKSPNPKGRPKKKIVEDLTSAMANFLAQSITIRTDGQKRTMNKLEAFTEILRVEALKGNPKATRQFFKIAAKTGLLRKDIGIPGVEIREPTTNGRNAKILRGMKMIHSSGSATTLPIASVANA